jgi:putative holliday junction resolvase
MRVLAIDYGERRTGLAVSDELGMTAQGLDTLVVRDDNELLDKIDSAVKRIGAETIVLGLPLNMDGTESEKSRKVREFGDKITARTGLPVIYRDERMTSVQAQRVMQELSMKTKGNKEQIDRIAATLLLEEYLKTVP